MGRPLSGGYMRKSWGVGIGAAAVTLTALMPGVALAQPTPPTPNGSTTTTFTVGPSGVLQISAPATTVDLTATGPTITPGGTITASLGTVTVTDLRSVTAAGWTVAVSSTGFTTPGGSPDETISAADVGYDPTGTLAPLFGTYTSLVGTAIAATDPNVTPSTGGPGLSTTPATVVTAAGADGDNQASWNPVITVDVPGSAVTGTYSGVITHSVVAS
jgi:hypothetical protein